MGWVYTHTYAVYVCDVELNLQHAILCCGLAVMVLADQVLSCVSHRNLAENHLTELPVVELNRCAELTSVWVG